MPACLKSWRLNVTVGSEGTWPVFLTATPTGGVGSSTRATVLVPDTDTVDLTDCAVVALSGAEYNKIMAVVSAHGGGSTVPEQDVIDYGVCASFWSFGLSTVVTLYLVSKYVGEIVGFIRTAIR